VVGVHLVVAASSRLKRCAKPGAALDAGFVRLGYTEAGQNL